eukprot:CAMPEP_0117432914 /NCGR_PEP_ID=MMETSP0758-20121206/12339_1 /TAXON_ID=63605 /ORGANISM="Percolomonas cosmopolitus, Strain AE-1 (ATCC 50343)" /LENGTH=987 /DNA_ID=CAMNT_0005223181 /DNA_START=192 /DNA_END=3155 /DNA_ORIENTATION=+
MMGMMKDGSIDSHISAASSVVQQQQHAVNIKNGLDQPLQPVPLTPTKKLSQKQKRVYMQWIDQRRALYPPIRCCATDDIQHPIYIKIHELISLDSYHSEYIRRKVLTYYHVEPTHPHYDFYLPRGRDIHLSLELQVNDAQIFQMWIPIYRNEHRQSHYLQNWLELPLNFADLTQNTQLKVTLYRFFSTDQFIEIGMTQLPFFDQQGMAYRGNHKLRFIYTHPALVEMNDTKEHFVNEFIELQQRMVLHANSSSWLNAIAKKRLAHYEKTYEAAPSTYYTISLSLPPYPFRLCHRYAIQEDDSNENALMLSSYIVMQQLKDHDDGDSLKRLSLRDATYFSILDELEVHVDVDNYYVDQLCLRDRMCTTDDSRSTQNPVSAMFRSFHSSAIDYTKVKPDVDDSKKLADMLHRSILVEPMEETRQLLFYYRYYLSTDSRYLVPYLRSVDWSSKEERLEALSLLPKWKKIDSYAALQLLTYHFAENTIVRDYAVSIIDESMDDDQFFDVLLQLVQSLRYEKDMVSSKLASILLYRAQACSLDIMTYLYWYLVVESDDSSKTAMDYQNLLTTLLEKQTLKTSNDLDSSSSYDSDVDHQPPREEDDDDDDLVDFSFNMHIEHVLRQRFFMDTLDAMALKIKNGKGDRIKKISILRRYLANDSSFEWPKVLEGSAKSHIAPHPTTLPLVPSLSIHEFDPSKSTIFKSAMNPLLLPFKVSSSASNTRSSFLAIYKSGDDLRQDQLVNQVLRLMDKILRENGLNMALTPYRVLATGRSSGFVECITPNQALSAVIKKSSIHAWLESQCSSSASSCSYASACRNFILSCAGYSVITYLLGIGDRHLDNILLSPTGRLFHIDFGYMLGRDPKPLPPPMKICSEMVVALKNMPPSDSSFSSGYDEFISLCLTAFIVLRRYASRFVTILVLMRDASIPDIDYNARSFRLRNIKRFEDKFLLSLPDLQARQALRSIIQESENAIAPRVTETIHRWAQYWRR